MNQQNNTALPDNLKSSAYFKALPSYVQENIMQSSLRLSNEQDLHRVAQNLMEGGRPDDLDPAIIDQK